MVYFDYVQIANISLIGLGLSLALYTMISNRLNDLQEERKVRLSSYKKQEEHALEKLANNLRDNESKTELKAIWFNLDQISSGNAYHYNWGYFVSGILFMSSLVGSFTMSYMLDFTNTISIDPILFVSKILLSLGLINFFIVWLLTMLDMRKLFRYKMDIIEGDKDEKPRRKLNTPKTKVSLF